MNSKLIMHTEKLMYFFEVANSGSFQACSRRLGLTASTLSYNVTSLEKVLNKSLFQRSKSGITLTKEGTLLWNFCQQYFKELEKIENNITNSKFADIINLRVGTFQSIALYFFPLLLDSLKTAPNISVNLTTDRSSDILELLVRKKIDLALTVETFKQSDLIRHEIYKDEYALYASKKFKERKFSKENIRNYSIIYIPDAIDQNKITLREHLRRKNLTFKEEFELDSFEVCAEFVSRGMGIGVLPTKVANRFKSQIKPIRINKEKTTYFGSHRFFLSYRKDLDLPNKLIMKIIKLADNAAKKMNRA